MPDLVLESVHWSAGRVVAGVDESGRGCLAGPVVAAAVVLPRDAQLDGLDDSKKLTPASRDDWFERVRREAISCGIGICTPAEIDRLNVLWASMEAMRRAVNNLVVGPDVALIDGDRVPPGLLPVGEPVVGGDAVSLSIAAASVIAKVTRDRLMCGYDVTWPAYGLASHKGYPTPEHYTALAAHGPTPLHRRSFRLSR
jgi:ribonuclease HII